MSIQDYPRLEINRRKLRENVQRMVNLCKEHGVDVAGVIKGANGLIECVQEFESGGVSMIASSRLEQLREAKAKGIKKPFLFLRVPMKTEVPEIIRLCDYSLVSEREIIECLDAEAEKQGKKHRVIVMADLGDLREGFWDKDELVDVCCWIEQELNHTILAGIGTNLGCYGAVEATPEKMEELVRLAERVEGRIGRQLQYISGGATTSLPRLFKGDMPKRINHLRIGEGILLARDLDFFYGYDMSFMNQDVFRLQAEVLEVKKKPSYPQGNITQDCFGTTPTYVDRGERIRALIGIGRLDYGGIDEIIPEQNGIEIIGASSDHTILDVEDSNVTPKVGDVLSFKILYAAMAYLTNSKNVNIVFTK